MGKGVIFIVAALVLFVGMTGAMLYFKGYLGSENMALLKEAFLGAKEKKPEEPAAATVQNVAPGLVKELQSRIEEYDTKLKRLADREKEIAQQHDELEKMRGEVDAEIQRIQKESQRIEVARATEVKSLADQFAVMEPESAAKQLEGLENHLAVAVLRSMKTKSRAEIFNVMKTERAIELQKEILSL